MNGDSCVAVLLGVHIELLSAGGEKEEIAGPCSLK